MRELRLNADGRLPLSDESIFIGRGGRFPEGIPDDERRRYARKELDRWENAAGLGPRPPRDIGKRKAASLAVKAVDKAEDRLERAEDAAGDPTPGNRLSARRMEATRLEAIAKAMRKNEEGGAEDLPSAQFADRAEACAEELRAEAATITEGTTGLRKSNAGDLTPEERAKLGFPPDWKPRSRAETGLLLTLC